ncbi:hypothetical protein ACE6H2_001881 [Prunus campanulata]
MADGSRSRYEAGQSLQERVKNHFPGLPRKLSEQEPQGEKTEQELPEKKKEAENTDESNDTFNITNNDISAIGSKHVGIRKAFNKEGRGVDQARTARKHNISGNIIHGEDSYSVGISNVGNTNYNKSSVPFLLGPLVLLVLAFFIYYLFYILTVSKQNKK